MADCELARRLSAYHDGELPADEARALEAHLLDCADCRRELEQLRHVSDLFAAVELPTISAEVLDRVRERASAARDRGIIRFMKTCTAIAASVLMFCCVWLALGSDASAREPGFNSPIERATLMTPSEIGTSAGSDNALMQWIVQDLSREERH